MSVIYPVYRRLQPTWTPSLEIPSTGKMDFYERVGKNLFGILGLAAVGVGMVFTLRRGPFLHAVERMGAGGSAVAPRLLPARVIPAALHLAPRPIELKLMDDGVVERIFAGARTLMRLRHGRIEIVNDRGGVMRALNCYTLPRTRPAGMLTHRYEAARMARTADQFAEDVLPSAFLPEIPNTMAGRFQMRFRGVTHILRGDLRIANGDLSQSDTLSAFVSDRAIPLFQAAWTDPSLRFRGQSTRFESLVVDVWSRFLFLRNWVIG